MRPNNGTLGRERHRFPGGWARSDARRRASCDTKAGRRSPPRGMSPCQRSRQHLLLEPGWQAASCTMTFPLGPLKRRWRLTGNRSGPFWILAAPSAWSSLTSLPLALNTSHSCRSPVSMETLGTVEVGVMKDLPVPVLIGRDWPGFDRLLAALTQPASPGGGRRKRAPTKRHHQRPVLLASDSRRDGESPSQNPNLFFDVFQQVTGGGSFGREQREDDRLKHCWAQVRILDGKEVQPGPHPLPHFVVQKGLLYCVAQRRGEEKLLLVVPHTKTETVLELAHSHPMAGHLGPANTIQRIRDRFHWPGMDAEVKLFCQACPTCQVTSPRKPPPSPLIPLPIIEVPFERIGMDLVGPLPKSARGHEHILVIVDYATRYPEAIPLRKATAKAIAQELFLLSSRVGIPAEILTDQGNPFMSRLMADLCRLLKVKQLRTTVYHPQADGLVERFN